MATSYKGKEATKSGPRRAEVDMRRDLFEVLEVTKSNFMKTALKTYQIVDKLILDHLKLVKFLYLAESFKEANSSIMEELAKLKTKLESVNAAH